MNGRKEERKEGREGRIERENEGEGQVGREEGRRQTFK